MKFANNILGQISKNIVCSVALNIQTQHDATAYCQKTITVHIYAKDVVST